MESEPLEGSVAYAAENGSRLDMLYALRAVVTRHIDSDQTLARDLAALTRRMQEIAKEIEELEKSKEVSASNSGGSDDDEDAPFSAEAI